MPGAAKIKDFMEQGSWIRKMFEEGIALRMEHGEENVFDLSLGNPVVEPPTEFFLKLNEVINDSQRGMHRYMPNAGFDDTRAAVASQLNDETGHSFSSGDIVMTCGAGGALNVVFKTILDPGDEVVIFAPFFVEYMFYVDNHGGKCKVVNPNEKFMPNMDMLRSVIGARTRAVLINSPNNPTGALYSSEILSQISDIIVDKEAEYSSEIYLISDEPYRKIIYDGAEYPHIFSHHIRSVVATSHSKDLALPGERIGYIAVHPEYQGKEEFIDGLVFCNRTLGFVNAPAMMQRIVASLQAVTIDVGHYQSKRDILYDELASIGYSVFKPQGAFYMFPASPIEDDVRFVGALKEHRVLAVPGTGFGMPGYFRLSYCLEDWVIQGAFEGLNAAFSTYS